MSNMKEPNIKQKSIAVSSGKGGVGKTTTAVNLAVYYARKNLRVCLVDVDPLSDIATLLDIHEPVQILTEQLALTDNAGLNHYLCRAFDNLDILFPFSKLKKQDSRLIFEKIYKQYPGELAQRYDLLIFDLPAGIRKEDNLIFLPRMQALILVTNAEPAAHVSAGGYLRVVRKITPQLPVFCWHNKFEKNPGSRFDPEDIVGNYNRNAPKETRIAPAALKNIHNLAYIPKDPSLDLLQSNPSVTLNIQHSLIDQLVFLKEERLKELARRCEIPGITIDLIKYYLVHLELNESLKDFISGLAAYISTFFAAKIGKIPKGSKVFTKDELQRFGKLYRQIQYDPLVRSLIKLAGHIREVIQKKENEKRLFFVGNTAERDKTIDFSLSSLLILLNENYNAYPVTIRNIAGLLLFYFSLFKLFQSSTLLKMVNDFIPVRKTANNKMVRDKRTQLSHLVEKNNLYRKKYFALIKKLFPVIMKQITTIVKTFNLNNLYYRNEQDAIHREAYIKLFSHFIHDTVNSGLGIITSFNFRPAALAFHGAADRLLELLGKRK